MPLLSNFPLLFLNPIFWGAIFLVGWQYNRLASLERHTLGVNRLHPTVRTAKSLLWGLAAGTAGSFVVVFLGLTVTGTSLYTLLATALLLMLIHPRLICFSYAGGLLSISSLLTGWPQVHVPSLAALVAVLHLMESMLVWACGHEGAVPVTIRGRGGKAVGGFVMQQFWPLPFVALVAAGSSAAAGGIPMPEWWPLIQAPPQVLEGGPEMMLMMVPVAAVLGYGDMSITSRPREKNLYTARLLALYSLALLALAWWAGGGWSRQLLTAVFTAGGHEVLIMLGRRRERSSAPLFTAPAKGVGILETLPGSAAAKAGLQPGDVILSVNGLPLEGPEDFAALEPGKPAELEIAKPGLPSVRVRIAPPRPDQPGGFGIVPILAPNSAGTVEIRGPGFGMRVLKRILRGLRR
ncbi:MAG: PDZ domain-containing protein [Firmicutes bacterium]|nr:PDZ domain-containing protein [Bacillota bacterium]